MAVEEKTNQKRIKPGLPGGFRDCGPEEARMKQWILDTARQTFERFGFEPLETSAVQKTEVLTGGEADSRKIIFNVRGSQEESASQQTDTSLRFDLTVPLARFVAANPDIPKPFKRYEIGKVWRGERQQAGRYREFTQADIDIVGSQSPDADAEIAAVIYSTLKKIGVGEFAIKINDRRILNDLPGIAGFPAGKLWEVLRIADKKDKIGEDGVERELTSAFDKATAAKIAEFFIAPLELPELKINLDAMGIPQSAYRFDRSMVRGLSYYTGSIFEAVLTGAPEIGSIFGGGRYDDLITAFTGQRIPAVGASLGVDRLLAASRKAGRGGAGEKLVTRVLILNLAPEFYAEYLRMAQELRERGVNAAFYLGDDRSFQAQLAYAVKKEIPYVIIYGEEEKRKGTVAVKNLATREQKEIPKEKMAEYFPL